MVSPDHRVFWIDHRQFRGHGKKGVWIIDEVLVQGIFVGDEDHGRILAVPAHPAGPLPGGHDGPRVSHKDAQIQIPDVDAQFQGRGGNHTEQFPRGQFFLDFPAFLGQKPGPIGRYLIPVFFGPLGGPDGDELGDLPGLGIDNGSQIPVDGGVDQGNGGLGRPLQSPHEKHIPMTPGGPAFFHHGHIQTGEIGAQRPRVGNGGRTKDKGGMGSIKGANPQEPAEYPGHVGAHHPPIGVDLVHHDEF